MKRVFLDANVYKHLSDAGVDRVKMRSKPVKFRFGDRFGGRPSYVGVDLEFSFQNRVFSELSASLLLVKLDP
jgi:hypothetical protein